MKPHEMEEEREKHKQIAEKHERNGAAAELKREYAALSSPMLPRKNQRRMPSPDRKAQLERAVASPRTPDSSPADEGLLYEQTSWSKKTLFEWSFCVDDYKHGFRGGETRDIEKLQEEKKEEETQRKKRRRGVAKLANLPKLSSFSLN